MLSLRDYQQSCVEALVAYRRLHDEGHPYGGQRALVALPTGTGKTVVFAQLPTLAKKRVLIIAHREELLDQAAAKIREANPGVVVGIEQAERQAAPSAAVVVASIQTLTVSNKRLQALSPDEFSTVVIDEAHHTSALSYLNLLNHFGLAPEVQDLDRDDLERKVINAQVRKRFRDFHPGSDTPFLVGFTATPSRTDGQGLEWVYDDIVFSRTLKEMMEAGWLCKIRGVQVHSGADISSVPTTRGDFQEKALTKVVDTPERNTLAVQAYQEHAGGRKALVFCVNVKHAEHMLEAFLAAGIRADMVVGETPAEKRRLIMNAYRQGALQVLVGVMVFTEGFDAPETGAILMARPTRSSLVYTQAVGRGTRIAQGKEDMVVIDLVDVSRKVQVQNLNTLFGLPPHLKLGRTNVLEMEGQAAAVMDGKPMSLFTLAETLEEIERIAREFDPLAQTVVEEYILAASSLAWVKTPSGYALGVMGRGQLGVVVDLLEHAALRLKVPQEPPVVLGQYGNPLEAIRAGDLWVSREAPEVQHVLDRTARWRRGPASSKQIALLEKLKGSDGKPLFYALTISKGDASALIDRYMKRRIVPSWVRERSGVKERR